MKKEPFIVILILAALGVAILAISLAGRAAFRDAFSYGRSLPAFCEDKSVRGKTCGCLSAIPGGYCYCQSCDDVCHHKIAEDSRYTMNIPGSGGVEN